MSIDKREAGGASSQVPGCDISLHYFSNDAQCKNQSVYY